MEPMRRLFFKPKILIYHPTGTRRNKFTIKLCQRDYQVVHMHGDLYFYHQDKAKLAAVGMLTQHHEDRVNGSEAWKMRDAPREFIKKNLDAIVAVEFKIQRIEAKSKLSQNRDAGDFDAVADKMQDLNLGGIARRMQKLKPDVG